MPNKPFDMMIRAGRLFCAASQLDMPGTVAIREGRIAAIGSHVKGTAAQTLDFPDGVLLPGLIDLHAHPAKSGSVFGVDPDEFILRRGTTTVGSQGDAGADNWPQYLTNTIDKSQTRILLAMNLSRAGEASETGCFENLADADVAACVQAVEAAGEHVWAIAVNVSHNACGQTDPHEIFNRGLQAAEATGLPLLFGMRRPEDWPLADQLQRLRPGDVVTYCYRSQPHCIVANARVLPEVRDARARGILFDVGHGAASFDFEVAAAAIADGFPPDTISTDLQVRHIGNQPQHDLPLTMSKLRAAGMPATDVLRAVTHNAARAMQRTDQLGTLSKGVAADLTLLEWGAEGQSLYDTRENRRNGGQWRTLLTVCGGRTISPIQPPRLRSV